MRKKVYVRSLDGFLSVCSTISNYIEETLMNRGSGRTRFKDRSVSAVLASMDLLSQNHPCSSI